MKEKGGEVDGRRGGKRGRRRECYITQLAKGPTGKHVMYTVPVI